MALGLDEQINSFGTKFKRRLTQILLIISILCVLNNWYDPIHSSLGNNRKTFSNYAEVSDQNFMKQSEHTKLLTLRVDHFFDLFCLFVCLFIFFLGGGGGDYIF